MVTILRLSLAAFICLVLAACAGVKPQGMAGVQYVASPNFDTRRPNLVVIHHTGGNELQYALRTLASPSSKVSAHYLIGRTGKIIQLVDERQRAWHAGVSSWRGQHDINSASIGIELDNNGNEPFAEAQIQALLALLNDLRARFKIPAANFVGHADVAPGRKVDPSAWFPWRSLARQGFGIWCFNPAPIAPAGFDLYAGLAAIGYDVHNPEAARQAFLLHFANGKVLGLQEQKALVHCLVQIQSGQN